MTKPDWNKPLRFAKVQSDDHATYRPMYVGSFVASDKRTMFVFVGRNWLDNSGTGHFSFLVYDPEGELMGKHNDIAASGIFDAHLVNGPEIREEKGVIDGAGVIVTFDGINPVKVRLEK